MRQSSLAFAHRFEIRSYNDQNGLLLQIAHCYPYESLNVALVDGTGRTRLRRLMRADRDGLAQARLTWAGYTEEHRLVVTSRNQSRDSAEILLRTA